MLKLVISDDEGKTTVVPLVRDEITIGRKEGNTIRLTERNVSRRHARISKRPEGFMLEDLASYNGIVLNGARLQEARSVKHGDQVLIGDYKLQIVDEPGAQVAPTPPPPPPPSEHMAPLLAAPAPPPPPAGSAPAAPGMAALNDPFAAPQQQPVPEHIRGLRLVFLAPAGVPAPVSLDKVPMVMGRSEAADVALPFSSISREHARIFLEDGKLFIEDMGSSNGITINDKKMPKGELAPGDMVKLGVVEFRVARRGDSTVVIQRAAEEERASAGKPNKGLLLGIIGGGVALGLAVLVVAGGVFKSNPSPTAAPEAPAAAAPSAAPATPEATPSGPRGGSARACAHRGARGRSPRGPPPPRPRQPLLPPSPHPPQPLHRSLRRKPRPWPRPSRRRPRRAAVATLVRRLRPQPQPPPRPQRPGPQPRRRAPSPHRARGGGGGGATGWDAAQACRSNSGSEAEANSCIVRALRSSNGEREMGLLATTYRAMGNRPQALATMRRYMQRYPNGSQYTNFQRYVDANSE